MYWLWNHRRWCLANLPDGPGTVTEGKDGKYGWKILAWSQEMMLVEKMLSLDARNCKHTHTLTFLTESPTHSNMIIVHAWNYRRYVLANCPPSLKRTDTDELAYTTKHIEKNHSNFSAWHQRSLVYSKLWAQDPESRAAVLDAGTSLFSSLHML